MRAVVIFTAAIILTASLVATFVRRGGPYLTKPQTVYDHVSRGRHPAVDDILLCRRAAPLMAAGASVTIVKPSEKPNYDTTHTNTAAGLLPYQRVIAPARGARADYAIAIRETFDDPAYRLLRSFPEGNLYERKR